MNIEDIEDKVKKQYWYVLERIKGISLKTRNDSTIDYEINYKFVSIDDGHPSSKDQEMILEKLEEKGVLKIIKKEDKYEDI